jgi:hypothetical protein
VHHKLCAPQAVCSSAHLPRKRYPGTDKHSTHLQRRIGHDRDDDVHEKRTHDANERCQDTISATKKPADTPSRESHPCRASRSPRQRGACTASPRAPSALPPGMCSASDRASAATSCPAP